MTRFDTLSRACGVAAPLVTLGAILVATLVSPSFSWASSALSDLGRPGAPTAAIFNGGLVLGALLALPFVARVGLGARRHLTRAGVAAFGLAAVSMGLVGVFPEGHAYHFPSAISLYLFVTYGLFLYGSGRVRAGATNAGLAAIWLGVAHVTSWVVWAAGLRVGPGLAVPETVGAGMFVAWIGLAWRLTEE
ncbi:DUF998 domain-containing protein [Halorussus aquaticus]|uniref:DUF998 domain-containing protein n=1 Tax=Halorussus aquaticus TaxID=2953748 RepID=A0ABD5PZG3_9EURY|nr:DUF998 domain-containing protein [Halorussus aquaticus]